MQKGRARLRVGIIGSGMAGSSAAHFVRQAFGGEAEIVVYERGPAVGGRVQEIDIAGRRVATGASIAHSANRYIARFVPMLGLHPERYPVKTVGIWNGRGFDFMTSGTRWRDVLRALRRYGLSPLRAERLVKRFVEQLVRVYDLLEGGAGFAHPRELFGALGLYDLSQMSSAEFFQREGISDRFVQEIVDGVSRGNYGQASDIHALVNLVSLAGAAMGGYLFSVREGNSAVCSGLLRASEATVRTGSEVVEIARLGQEEGHGAEPAAPTGRPAGGYRVTTAAGETDQFAAVIVAAPLEVAGIRFAGTAPLPQPLRSRPFQTTHVTFVVGQLNPAYFGLRTAEELPAMIMTRESPGIPFSGIGTWGKASDSDHVLYKLFSRQELSDALLSEIFSRSHETRRLVWKAAYPVLRPESAWPPFVLDRGLYYVNAMESAVSTMETEIVASRNVVNLLANDLPREPIPDRR